MLLPQSTAYRTLSDRLATVSTHNTTLLSAAAAGGVSQQRSEPAIHPSMHARNRCIHSCPGACMHACMSFRGACRAGISLWAKGESVTRNLTP